MEIKCLAIAFIKDEGLFGKLDNRYIWHVCEFKYTEYEIQQVEGAGTIFKLHHCQGQKQNKRD